MRRLWHSRLVRGIIIALIDIILVASMYILYKHYNRNTSSHRTSLREQREELELLQERQLELEQRLSAIDKEFREKTNRPTGFVVPLFFDMNQDMLPDIVFSTRSGKWAGMIALAPGELPGNDGKISMQQFHEYLGDGWKYCVAWDGETDLHTFIRTIRNRLAERDIEWPGILYFPVGTYKSAYDDMLREANIRIVIHHGEEELEIPTRQIRGDGLEKTAAVDWRAAFLKDSIKTARSQGAIMVVDFKSSDGRNDVRLSDMKGVISDLSQEKSNYQSLNLTTLSEAVDAMTERQLQEPQRKEAYLQKREEPAKELEQVLERIEELTGQ